MTTEEKFRAAVNVIRSLPKNGTYQPSHDLMLRFYGYFKQATEGPCVAPRPGFWEIVKKMKWDAWNKLGNMSREEAMNNYVDELKKIVETMSYTDNVADFLGSLGSFYDSVPVEDLELLVGNVIERIRSQPGSPLSGSPLGSRSASPHRTPVHITSSLETSPATSQSASPLPPAPEDDDDEEEFIDTVEMEEERVKENGGRSSIKKSHVHMNGHAKSDAPDLPNSRSVNVASEEALGGDRSRPRERSGPKLPRGGQEGNVDISQQVREAVLHLQRDLDRVTARVRSLEVQSLSGLHEQVRYSDPSFRRWWPFPDLSSRTFAFLVMWPFIAQGLLMWIQRRRANRP